MENFRTLYAIIKSYDISKLKKWVKFCVKKANPVTIIVIHKKTFGAAFVQNIHFHTLSCFTISGTVSCPHTI